MVQIELWIRRSWWIIRYQTDLVVLFVFNDTAATEIYTYGHTLSLHDALPISNDWLAAGQAEHDPLWRLPLWQPYQRYLKSSVADLANSGSSRMAGSVTADRKSTRLNSSH